MRAMEPPAESVGCCGIVAMVGGLPIAGKGHDVFWVLEVTMRPAILRAIQAEVETLRPRGGAAVTMGAAGAGGGVTVLAAKEQREELWRHWHHGSQHCWLWWLDGNLGQRLRSG